MMKIVLQAGYHGYVGIEYEGDADYEVVGIHKTKALLERVCKAFALRARSSSTRRKRPPYDVTSQRIHVRPATCRVAELRVDRAARTPAYPGTRRGPPGRTAVPLPLTRSTKMSRGQHSRKSISVRT